jgi:hypothetical protein
MDPNFPENLNIAPSAPPAHHGLSGRFDASMQRDAIEKFGIAGRVWYCWTKLRDIWIAFTYDDQGSGVRNESIYREPLQLGV